VAVTVSAPEVPFAVKVLEVARPFASVVSVSVPVPFANVPLAPEAGAVKVTIAPGTGFPPTSTTFATSGAGNALLIGVDWGLPDDAVIAAGDPVVFVSVKVAGAEAPFAVAVTTYVPAWVFAVNEGEMAMPLTSVVAVAVVELVLEKVALGPLVGAVNVTTTPLLGVPFVVTVATRAAPKVPPTP